MALILEQFIKIFCAEEGDTDEYYFDKDKRQFFKKEEAYKTSDSHIPVMRLKKTDLFEEYLNIKGIAYLLPDEVNKLDKIYGKGVMSRSVAMLYLTGSIGLDDDMNDYAYFMTMHHINEWATTNQIENVKLSYNAFDLRTLENYNDFFIRDPTNEERKRKQTFMENEIAKEAEDERVWQMKRSR